MLKYNVIEIKLNESHTVQSTVPVWEVPVIRALHPELVVLEEKLVKRDPPEVDDEFRRLAKRYHNGKPEDGSPEEVSFVAKVYGTFGIGTRALATAIREATVDAQQPVVDDLAGDVQLSSVGG